MKYIYVILLFGIIVFQSSCKKKDNANVPTPTITSISKSVLLPGDTLVIQGSGFSTVPTENLVSIASVAYQVIKATANQLSVIVPKGGHSGSLTISISGGQSFTYGTPVSVVSLNQPFVTSISPADGAYESDTVTVNGGNFAVPYSSNTVTFSGIPATVYNVTSNELKFIVPPLTQSGNLFITSLGVTSLPYSYKVKKIDPAADGNLYWRADAEIDAIQSSLQNNNNAIILNGDRFFKGLVNTTLIQGSLVYDPKIAVFPISYGFYDTYGTLNGAEHNFYSELKYSYCIGSFYSQTVNADNDVVTDHNGNAYYLQASSSDFPINYNLMKFNLAQKQYTPTIVWTQNFPSAIYDKYNNSGITANIRHTPVQQLTINNNTVYIKLGISDDYYVGDLSAANPNITLQHNPFGVHMDYRPLFGNNFIFYSRLGVDAGGYVFGSPTFVGEIDYVKVGSKTSSMIQGLPTFQYLDYVQTLADPTHGNNILIIYKSSTNGTTTIYKFNADNQTLTTLYSPSNWRCNADVNSGFLWLGSHIYYTGIVSTGLHGLFRLEDNGSSKYPLLVYGQLEDHGATNAFQQINLFSGK